MFVVSPVTHQDADGNSAALQALMSFDSAAVAVVGHNTAAGNIARYFPNRIAIASTWFQATIGDGVTVNPDLFSGWKAYVLARPDEHLNKPVEYAVRESVPYLRYQDLGNAPNVYQQMFRPQATDFLDEFYIQFEVHRLNTSPVKCVAASLNLQQTERLISVMQALGLQNAIQRTNSVLGLRMSYNTDADLAEFDRIMALLGQHGFGFTPIVITDVSINDRSDPVAVGQQLARLEAHLKQYPLVKAACVFAVHFTGLPDAELTGESYARLAAGDTGKPPSDNGGGCSALNALARGILKVSGSGG